MNGLLHFSTCSRLVYRDLDAVRSWNFFKMQLYIKEPDYAVLIYFFVLVTASSIPFDP